MTPAVSYLKVRSWHILAKVDAAGWKTRCGLTVNEDAPVTDILPFDEKSCESCLRGIARDFDQAAEVLL